MDAKKTVIAKFSKAIAPNICIKPILVNTRVGVELSKNMPLEPRTARNL
jgi:hypothetical protein